MAVLGQKASTVRPSFLTLLAALIALPARGAVPSGFWTPEKHREVILFLDGKFPLAAKHMRLAGPGSACSAALSTQFQVELTGKATYRAAFRVHGEDGWEKALADAGFDPNGIRLEFRWTPEIIKSCLRVFHAYQIPLYQASFREESRWKGRIERILLKMTKRPLGSRTFASALLRHFNENWAEGVLAAQIPGIDLDSILHEADWTDDKVIACLKKLNGEKVALHPYALANDTTETTKAHLKTVMNFSVTGAALYDQAIVRFGSWKEALARAGLNWEEIYRRPEPTLSWSPDLVVQVLAHLQQTEQPTEFEALSTLAPVDLPADLVAKLGGVPSGYAVLGAARYHHGSLQKARDPIASK